MASNYPASLDTFTTKVDHVDNYEASHVNDLQNAIIAIQTELGADPAGAASNLVTRLKSLMDAYACTTTATGDNQVLTDASNGLHFVTPSAAIDYTLPVVGSANHPFAIMNLSDTYSITVKNSNGTTIGTVAPGEGRTFVSNSNAWVDTSISVAASSIPDTTAAYDFLVGNGTDWQKKTLAETKTALGVDVKTWGGTISNPQAVYASRPQIVMMRTKAAITITRIHIHCSDLSPTTELAGDLKFADDINTGGFANATIIDVCDTTNGVTTITSGFDDATVPSGKYIYFQMDASPHADITDFYIEFYYTVD